MEVGREEQDRLEEGGDQPWGALNTAHPAAAVAQEVSQPSWRVHGAAPLDLRGGCLGGAALRRGPSGLGPGRVTLETPLG